jgi:hypothetical protein
LDAVLDNRAGERYAAKKPRREAGVREVMRDGPP